MVVEPQGRSSPGKGKHEGFFVCTAKLKDGALPSVLWQPSGFVFRTEAAKEIDDGVVETPIQESVLNR